MGFCDVLCVVVWNIALVLSVLLPWCVAKLGLCLVHCLPARHKTRALRRLGRLVIVITCISWRMLTTICCWVRIRIDGLQQFRKELAATAGRPRVCISNHTSFMDSILYTSIMPLSQVGSMKALAAAHLLKVPVLGTLLRASGHVCVPFTSKDTMGDDFSVDKDLLAERMHDFEACVAAGSIGCWYPEGRTNPGDATQVQLFRAGGFGVAVHQDVEIWCIVWVGNPVCWPRKAAFGGRPCRIRGSIFRLCDSSHTFLAGGDLPPGNGDERSQCIYLADRARAEFQAAVNNIVAEGWCSGAAGSGVAWSEEQPQSSEAKNSP
eukprot:gnl/TRDRNA2_/TRDRNA2_193988_c0_seq1.p1 gnl/TRDRNA2_/TRDRNA2_193988_c0~~gnl/TRDRNA2_/TRDRNA2_193988_c0_seq1.p1  ORF type:complete len:321 (-),score=48.40 gnl/TRDRNA2_/TRDRNA2_193988_c0_seq1:14-976(-)